MSISEPGIRANMLHGLADLLASRNLSLTKLLEEVGLDPNLEPDHNTTLPLNSYSRLLERAASESKDDCFGLHFAMAFPRGAMGALGYLVLNAPDLGTCMECMRRYVRLQCEAIDFELKESHGVFTMKIVCGPTFVAPRKQFLELIMAITVGRLSGEFGDGWKPLRVEFEYREPNCGGEYEALFGRNLEFAAEQTTLSIKSDMLKSRSPRADDGLFRMLRGVAESLLQQADRQQDTVWKVSEYIVNNLATGASLEGGAMAVGRSSRQLQGELKRLGTTFDTELGRVRRGLAERYLSDTDLPLTDVALMLGFSELSAFTRAARGWLGMPPSIWRQDVRRKIGQ